MLLFDVERIPAQFLEPSNFERPKDHHQNGDAAKAESKERVTAVALLFCVLAAGIYGEILRHAF